MYYYQPCNHVLDGGYDPAHEKGQFWGLSDPLKSIKALLLTAALCAANNQ